MPIYMRFENNKQVETTTLENKPESFLGEDSSPKKPRFFSLTEVQEPKGIKRTHIEESESEAIKTKRMKISEEYPASGLKLTLHGNIYQLKLLMLFLHKGLKKEYSFLLATEMDAAEKFDDLVFQYENERKDGIIYRFLQAKHKQDESKKITVNDLLTEKDGEFSLQKYFISYRKIKENPEFKNKNSELKDFVICTNIDLDENLQDSFESVGDKDDILDIQYNGKESKRLKFKINNFRDKENLISILENTSDLNRLAKKLAESVLNNKPLNLQDELFRSYHGVLAKKVVDVENAEQREESNNKGKVIRKSYAKFHNSFLDGSSQEKELENFRNAFLEAYLGRLKEQADIDAFWQEMKTKELQTSKNFGKVFEPSINLEFTNTELKEFVDAIVNAMSKAQEGVVTIRREGGKGKGIIKDNINKLAGYVLIKKNDKERDVYYFSSAFFDDDNQLPSSLESFRSELTTKLESEGVGFNKDKYKFHIANFPTCEEGQLYMKPTLPDDYIAKEEIENFFEKLVFAVNQPNEIELGKVIESEIGEEFNNIDRKNIYSRFQKKMLNWMKEKKGRFFSYEEGKDFFEKVKEEILGAIWFDVREPVESFTGRAKELEKLHELVQRKGELTVISQITSISGLGGVGKSELARKYVQKYSQGYDGNVIWINAEKYETMVESFLKLARDNRMGIPTKDKDGKEKNIESIVKEIYVFFAKRKSLFIFDNAEKHRTQKKEDGSEDIGVDRFLPFSSLPSNGEKPYFIITSRNQNWGNAEVLRLDTFTEEEAMEFIKKILNIGDNLQNKEIKQLAETLQHFPLALQQAVAYIRERDKELRNIGQEFKIADYLKKYEEKAKELLGFKFPEDSSNPYTETTFITWKITLETIKKEEYGEQALEILNAMAYFASNDIPVEIFLGFMEDDEKLGSTVQLLKQYSMVSSEEEQAILNIHRLVQEVTRLKLRDQNKEEETLRKVLGLLDKNMAKENLSRLVQQVKRLNVQDQINEETLERVGWSVDKTMEIRNLNHAMSTWGYTGKYGELVKEFSEMPIHITNKLYYSGRYEEAYLFGKRASKLLKEVLGPDHPSTLATRNNIALALRNQGKYEEALKIYNEVYEKRKNILGPDHSSTLATRNNMALVLKNQGKYEEALKIYNEVYEKRKNILGPDHPDTLITRNNIALALQNQGKYEEALKIYNKVYEKEKDILGLDHPGTLTTRGNMAGVLKNQGKYNEALKIYNEVYEKRKNILGPEHPSTLTTRNNMASVLSNQDEAFKIYNEVYEKRKDILGFYHPDTLTTLNCIALALLNQGKYEKAFQAYNEVYGKSKDILGPDHPDTLAIKNNMAGVLDKQGKYEEAFKTYNEVYEIWRRELGPDHPSTLTTRNNMALVLGNQGQYEEALKIFNEVFEISKRKLGPDHPSTLTTRNNIAGVLFKQGQYKEALQIYREVYEIWERKLGPDHPSTLTTRNNIAGVLYNQGQYEEALKIFNEVYDRQKNVLGLNHPNTLTIKSSIDAVQYALSRDLTPLHLAVKDGRRNAVEVLLNERANPNTPDSDGLTPLCYAVQNKHQDNHDDIEIIKILLGYGADYNITAKNGITILHFAAIGGNFKIVKYLWDEILSDEDTGIDVENINKKDNNGFTPLHYAAKGGYLKVVIFLRFQGADINVLNNQGQTPRDLADKYSHSDIVNLLNSYSSGQSTQSHEKQQKAFLRLSKFTSYHFPHATTISVKQGLYLSSFETRNLKISGKCVAITRSFSQVLFLQQQDNLLSQKPHKSFLDNLQTSAELYERLTQGKQISTREERKIFDLSKLLDGFEQQLDSSTSSLPSLLSHVKSYKTLGDLSRYIGDLAGDFAIHLVTSNHVVAIYRSGDNYAHFDSNVAFVSGLKSVDQLIEVLEKAVKFAGYDVEDEGFLVEHFDVTKANNALTAKQKQTLTKPIQTERYLLSLQDQRLGHIDLNGKQVSRVTLYDLGAKLHLEGSSPILINADMNLSNENLLAYLNTRKVSITAQEYLESLRNNIVERTQELTQATKVIPFTGSRNEIKHAQQVQGVLSSDAGSKLKSYELNNLLQSPIEKSIKALPYYLEVAKTKHWPDRLTNAAGRIQLIRGLHGATVSCDRDRGNTKDCLLNTGEISLSLVSQLIEDKVVQNVPKLIKSLKTVKFGTHILRGGAAIISSPFDVYDIIDSAIDLHNCEKGSSECKDAIAGVTFASTSLASGVVLTAIGAPGVGTAVGLVIVVAQGAYSGARMIEEFESYNLTFDENFRLFWNTFALQPIPKDIEYIKARKDIIDQTARQIWEQLQNRDEYVVDYATGLGEITFEEKRECKPVQEGLDSYQACTHRKVRIPTLSPNNATILTDLSSIKGYNYKHFLSRILPKSPADNAEISCAPSFSGKSHERDYTLSNGYPLYSGSSTVASYCENAMVITHKKRMNKIQIHGNKKIVFDLNLVNHGIVVGSDNRQNEFIVSKGKAKVLGGENAKNAFILTSDFAGTIFGGKNSTNILDVSNLRSSNYSLYIDNLSSFNRTSYVQDCLTNKVEKQSGIYGINNLVISANTTVAGNGNSYTFYIKPAPGYSKVNVSKGSIIFPETALLLDCDSFTYSPERNVLSMKFSNFTLDIGNYFNRDQKICNFELIDKHGSLIEPLVDLAQQEVKLFNLRAETDLTYNNIIGWYENIAEASEKYQIYGTVKVKYEIVQEKYGSYPNMIFGSEKSDIIPLAEETWYAEGREGSDSYNVISNRNSSITTEINNYAEDEVLDLLYMSVNSIRASKDGDNLHLYSANSTHSVKVKDYFVNSSYQHLTVIDENKNVFVPRESSLNDQVQLVPFYHATKDQYTFSLSAEKVAGNSEVIVDAKLDNIKLYKDGNNLLLIDEKPIIVKLENFYDKHESWQNLTINFWHGHHKDKLNSQQLFELAKLAIDYQDEIKSAYYDSVKEYMVPISNTTIYHNQELTNGTLATVEPSTKRVGVLVLQDDVEPSGIEVSVNNEDLVFFIAQNNATFTIKNWNDTDHRVSTLRFNQAIEIRGLDKFDSSQVSEIQSLVSNAALNGVASQQLEKLDSNVANGIKYLLAVRGIENGIGTHKCLGFDSAEEEQQFISAYHSRYSLIGLDHILGHSQGVEALVWLIVKGYSNLSLENHNVDRRSLLNNLDKCFNVAINKRTINRIMRKLEVEDLEAVVPNVESFVKRHKEALEDKIVSSLRSNTTEITEDIEEHQRKRRDTGIVKDQEFFNAQNDAIFTIKNNRATRGHENNNDQALFYGQNNANSSLKGKQVTSGGNKLSSWISDLFGWAKSSITGFLAPSTEQVSGNIVQPEISNTFVDGFLMLSDVGVRKLTGNKYKQPKHDSLLSPKELIEQRIDHTAINAINNFERMYGSDVAVERPDIKSYEKSTASNVSLSEGQTKHLPYLPAKMDDKPRTCLDNVTLDKSNIRLIG